MSFYDEDACPVGVIDWLTCASGELGDVTFFFSLVLRCGRGSPLFPYTTLFRSRLSTTISRSPEKCRPICSRRRRAARSEEHTSELQSHGNLVCRLLLEKKTSYGTHTLPSIMIPSNLNAPSSNIDVPAHTSFGLF